MGILKNNNKILTDQNKPLWNPGVLSGLKFDGVNDYVDFGGLSAADPLALVNANDEITVHCVGVFNYGAGGRVVLAFNDNFASMADNSWSVRVGIAGNFILQKTPNTGSSNNFSYVSTPQTQVTGQIAAATFVLGTDGTKPTASDSAIYINYEKAAVQNTVEDYLATDTIIIGSQILTIDQFQKKQDDIIYQLFAFDKALSQSEVESLQGVGVFSKIPPSLYPNVIGAWNFGQRHGDVLPDDAKLYNPGADRHDGTILNAQTDLSASNQWVDLNGNPILR